MQQKNEARHCSNYQVAIETYGYSGRKQTRSAFTKKKRRRKTNSIPKQGIKPKVPSKNILLQFNSFIFVIIRFN